ncbi:RmlC-like cupin domain-containing protein [Aspergillus pseudoustus]|uniref:RmlC-like cupin domain-containing protein n=1 Tax=Aspergillus pseudoustus TaxID=1810923 RepID=A0ABR4ISG5_9EURO
MLFASALTTLALAIPALAAPKPLTKRADSDLSLNAQLKLANTADERYALLPDASDFVFDFTTGAVVATSETWPALTGVGASFSMGSLPGCGMAFLHLHPRATELFSLHSGRVQSSMTPGIVDSEGNQRIISVELTAGQVTLYPQGSFHTQFNPDCEPANFTASFTSEEFAAGIVPSQLFTFSNEVIDRSFGGSIEGEDIETIRDAIPAAQLILVEECLATCGREKR